MNRTQIVTDRAVLVSALIAACAFLAPACSSNDAPAASSPDAGAGGATSSSGGKAASSAGGKAAGGAGVGAGGGGGASGGAGGTATGGADAGTDSGGPPLAPLSGTLIVAAADFNADVGEIATINLATGALIGHVTVSDGDVALTVSGGRAFAMEREGGALDVLSATGTITEHIGLGTVDGGGSTLNPHDALLVTGTSKAYVPLYGGDAIAIVNVDTGTQTGSISLAPFLDPTDSDGSSDPDSVYYDAAAHRAYFLLGRIDIYSGTLATSYTPACPPVSPLIIAIDTDTDAIVDLNGDGGGVGIELPVVGPGAWARDETSGTLYVVADGCAGVSGDGGFERLHDGIASVNLTTRATQVLYSPTSQDFLSTLLPLGGSTYALATEDSNFATTFRHFDPAYPASLGAALEGVPDSAIVGGPGTFLGLKSGRSADGGSEQQVVRYDVATARTSDVTAFQWAHSFSFATMAWVK